MFPSNKARYGYIYDLIFTYRLAEINKIKIYLKVFRLSEFGPSYFS